MSVKISGRFLGGKKIELTHELSGTRLITDAPLDNHGEASSFSPTDLVTGALGACIMTVLAIMAERHEIDLTGMRMEAEKHMTDGPRRIARIDLQIHLPGSIAEELRPRLEKAAHACPVHNSLSSQIEMPIQFRYDVEPAPRIAEK